VTVSFSFDDEPTVNSKNELTVATSGSQNLRRRSNCNLCACTFPPCATRSPSRGRACPTLPSSAAMYAEGTASRPPTAKGLALHLSSGAGSCRAANKVIRIIAGHALKSRGQAQDRINATPRRQNHGAVEKPQGWRASLALHFSQTFLLTRG
jgi:hypothetical protein